LVVVGNHVVVGAKVVVVVGSVVGVGVGVGGSSQQQFCETAIAFPLVNITSLCR